MKEYALMQAGEIVNVVMTAKTISAVRESYPDFRVENLNSLSADVKQRYRYWNERP